MRFGGHKFAAREGEEPLRFRFLYPGLMADYASGYQAAHRASIKAVQTC